MRLAVTAASGQLGSAIVRELKRRDGVIPIAIARTPDIASSLDVETRAGDYDKRGQLETAFAGVETAVMVSGMAAPDTRIVQHKKVIDAARTAGVRRMVYTGIVVKDAGAGFIGIQRCSVHTEEHLAASGMEWAAGRNGIYVEPDLEYIPSYVAT